VTQTAIFSPFLPRVDGCLKSLWRSQEKKIEVKRAKIDEIIEKALT